MKPEQTIDYPIRLAWNRIARIYNNKAAEYGTSMATGFILLNIDQDNGTPSTRLGPMLGLEPRSLVRTLAGMEEKGLICRKADPNDKRMVRIFLTEFGKEKRKVSKQAVISLNEYIQGHISDNKLKIFFEVLEQINGLLERNDIFEQPSKSILKSK